MKKNNKLHNTINLIYTSFKMSPANYFTLFASSFVMSSKSIVEMILPALLIDVITKSKTFDNIMIVIFIYAIVILIADGSEKAFSLLSTAFGYTANNRASLLVGQKGMRVDYEAWENPDTYEKNVRAKNSSWVFQSMADMICENWLPAILTMIPVIYILYQVNIVVIIVILILVIFELFLERHADKKIYDIDKKKATEEKKLRYNEKVMTDLKYGKELRLYNGIKGVLSKYEKTKKNVFSHQMDKKRINTNQLIISRIITSIETIIIFYFAVKQYENGLIALSSFLLLIGAVNQFTESAKTIIETGIWIQDLVDYYSDYKTFMDEPENLLNTKNLQNLEINSFDIEFRNVSFRYPGQKDYVIKDINLFIPDGTKLAIVGENGAGKTTLIKLLLRLYDTSEGEILIGGKNIKELDYTSYLKLFAPVFQDFKLHAYSLRQNVQFLNKDNDKFIWELLERQGMYDAIKNTPNGLDTFITKQLDEHGKDFSGGEKQRIAMVRALYKMAPIYVLDEPTSAIDPLSELEYFKNLHRETKDKTAIYITHRMASTKKTDIIIVMDKGKIVESGNFEELMNRKGIFFNTFKLQSSYYNKVKD